MSYRISRDESGVAFVVVISIAIISILIVGISFSASLAKSRGIQLHEAETGAFYAAESVLSVCIESTWRTYCSTPPGSRVDSLDVLDGKYDPQARFVVPAKSFRSSVGRAWIREVRVVPGEYADVEYVARGENRYSAKTLVVVVRFGHASAKVFDNAYFTNNFGWLYGAGVTVNGSVHANGDFSAATATVNGDVCASENAELMAAGTITGDIRLKDIHWYNANYSDRARPTSPSAPPEDTNGDGILDPGEDRNGNCVLDDFADADGYDGTQERYTAQSVIDMPYLGDLSVYETLAIDKGGTLTHGGQVVVDAVLGDDPSEPENLLLVGTTADPIIIDGPVVVANDVVLKGVIKGQGTIYAGRNVHIIGSLEYAAPPTWPKPLENPGQVAAQNATRDLVGLVAKGSVIIGNYTTAEWNAATSCYQEPPFTQAYAVDPSDDALGYVSYYDGNGRPMFDGDYRAFDGGFKATAAGGLEARRFFESSLPDATIDLHADLEVCTVDAVIYTDHLLGGKVGAATLNGALVSRDESIIYDGSLIINYDIRTLRGGTRFLDVSLPREPVHRVIYWAEAR